MEFTKTELGLMKKMLEQSTATGIETMKVALSVYEKVSNKLNECEDADASMKGESK